MSFEAVERRRADRPRLETPGRRYVADYVYVASWGASLRVEVYGLIVDRRNGDRTNCPDREVFLGHLSLKTREPSKAIRLTRHGDGSGGRVTMDRDAGRAVREWARALWAAHSTADAAEIGAST